MPFFYENGGNNARYEFTGKRRDRRRVYKVIEGFSYWTNKVGGRDGVRIVVKAGFETDLASIPSLPFLPNPGGSLWDDAAIVHDMALVAAAKGFLTYAEADAVFYYALRDRGCSVFTAALFWAAVRLRAAITPIPMEK